MPAFQFNRRPVADSQLFHVSFMFTMFTPVRVDSAIPLVSVEVGLGPSGFWHSSQPLPKPSFLESTFLIDRVNVRSRNR